jgi:hypothetical protein
VVHHIATTSKADFIFALQHSTGHAELLPQFHIVSLGNGKVGLEAGDSPSPPHSTLRSWNHDTSSGNVEEKSASMDSNFYPGSAKFQQAYAFATRKRDPLILGPASFAAGTWIEIRAPSSNQRGIFNYKQRAVFNYKYVYSLNIAPSLNKVEAGRAAATRHFCHGHEFNPSPWQARIRLVACHATLSCDAPHRHHFQ